jgi:hypothetical protein
VLAKHTTAVRMDDFMAMLRTAIRLRDNRLGEKFYRDRSDSDVPSSAAPTTTSSSESYGTGDWHRKLVPGIAELLQAKVVAFQTGLGKIFKPMVRTAPSVCQ